MQNDEAAVLAFLLGILLQVYGHRNSLDMIVFEIKLKLGVTDSPGEGSTIRQITLDESKIHATYMTQKKTETLLIIPSPGGSTGSKRV
ncbi:hypothetical protein QQP08_010074 [Theobroma cacao]|nr:hypothetical protein QQP08_010074 [Theobroma cacao]